MTGKIAHSCGRIWTAHCSANSISIGSAIFAQLIHVPNTQTHRPRYMQHL